MFSFFNAGSGTNQSNHLFKSGAVHQAVHLRGCKFASDAYVMSPALEGAFTMVMGHHTHHHDTSDFPFSYLIEKEGRSVLMPGANLASYGTVRDIEKWPTRDHRTRRRDVVNFEPFNPYLTEAMLHAVDTLHTLADGEPDAPFYNYRKTVIRQTALRRGITLYNKAIAAALGAMLERGGAPLEAALEEPGHWLDVAGAYITRSEVEALCDAVERGELTDPREIDDRFRDFARRYDDQAHRWALSIYARLLGHLPSEEEIAEAVRGGHNAREALREMTDAGMMECKKALVEATDSTAARRSVCSTTAPCGDSTERPTATGRAGYGASPEQKNEKPDNDPCIRKASRAATARPSSWPSTAPARWPSRFTSAAAARPRARWWPPSPTNCSSSSSSGRAAATAYATTTTSPCWATSVTTR